MIKEKSFKIEKIKLSKRRFFNRGYNQAELLALGLSEKLGIKYRLEGISSPSSERMTNAQKRLGCNKYS